MPRQKVTYFICQIKRSGTSTFTRNNKKHLNLTIFSTTMQMKVSCSLP